MARSLPFVLLLSESSARLLCPDGAFHDAMTPKDEPALLCLIDQAPHAGMLFVLDHAAQAYIPTEHPALKRRDAKLLHQYRLAEAFPDALYRAVLHPSSRGAVLAGANDCAAFQRWRLALAERPNPFLGAVLLPVACDRAFLVNAKTKAAELIAIPSLQQRIRLVLLRDGRFFYARHCDATRSFSVEEEAEKVRAYVARFGVKHDEAVLQPQNAADKILLYLQRKTKGAHRFFLPAEGRRHALHLAKRALDIATTLLFLMAFALGLRAALDLGRAIDQKEKAQNALQAASARLENFQGETPETPVDQLRAALQRDQIFTTGPDFFWTFLEKLGGRTNADTRLQAVRAAPSRHIAIDMRFPEESARDASRLLLQDLTDRFDQCSASVLAWPQERLSSDKPKDDPSFSTATYRLICAEEK